MDICKGLTTNPYEGKICIPGYIKGVVLFENKPLDFDKESLKTKLLLENLILADRGLRAIPLNFVNPEITETEDVIETFDDGSTVKITEKNPANKFQVVATPCSLKSIYAGLKNGLTMYALYFTSEGVFRGKEVDIKTIRAVKVNVYASQSDATIEATGKVNVYIQDLENYMEKIAYVKPDYDITTIEGVQTVELLETGTTSTTSLQVEAYDCKGNNKTGLSLTPADWVLYNKTTGLAVTPTNVTLTGTVYNLDFAAQNLADIIQVSLSSPSVSQQKYETLKVIEVTL